MREMRRSRSCRLDRARGGLSSSIAKLRRLSFHGGPGQQGGEGIRGRNGKDDDDTVTSDTVSCASDDSSCFDAGEGKGKSSKNDASRLVPAAAHIDSHEQEEDGYDADTSCPTLAASACDVDPHVDEEEDGYETDKAVVCDDVDADGEPSPAVETPIEDQGCQREEPIRDRHAARSRKVQQAVDQLLLEQNMALEAWDEVASEYQRRIEPFTSLFVPHLLDSRIVSFSPDIRGSNDEHLHFLEGKSVLDVAAGTGAGSMYAASKGASSVTATDFSDRMLRRLRRRLREHPSQGIVETETANGMCLPLEWEGRYDVVMSNFGVIYFPKVKEGLLEMIRCTKPGGRVCFSGWGGKEETHAFSVFPAAMKRCGFDTRWYRAQSAARKSMLADAGIVPESPRRRRRKNGKRKKRYSGISLTPNFFCPTTRISSSRPLLHSMLTDAGLENVRVVPVTKHLQLDSAESYWNRFVLASPNLKRFVEHCLDPEEVGMMKGAVSDILHEESCEAGNPQECGVLLRASAYVAIGTKASADGIAGQDLGRK